MEDHVTALYQQVAGLTVEERMRFFDLLDGATGSNRLPDETVIGMTRAAQELGMSTTRLKKLVAAGVVTATTLPHGRHGLTVGAIKALKRYLREDDQKRKRGWQKPVKVDWRQIPDCNYRVLLQTLIGDEIEIARLSGSETELIGLAALNYLKEKNERCFFAVKARCCGLTLRQVGEVLGRTPETVRQIEMKGYRVLRHSSSGILQLIQRSLQLAST